MSIRQGYIYINKKLTVFEASCSNSNSGTVLTSTDLFWSNWRVIFRSEIEIFSGLKKESSIKNGSSEKNAQTYKSEVCFLYFKSVFKLK